MSAQASVLRERILTDLIRLRKSFAACVHNNASLAGLVMILIFVFMSVGAPILVGPYPSQFDRSTPFQSPTSAHPLGTDWQGFDILKLVMYGGQISLLIGFVSSFVAMVIGTSVGLVAGYYGRVTAQVLSRATDVFLVIPWLPFVVVLSAVLGPSLETTIVASAVVISPTAVGAIRAQVPALTARKLG